MTRTWSIGDVSIGGGAILAPLSGVTDVAFRRIAHRFGAALVVSEMVAADELVNGSEEARLRAAGEGVSLHVVQIAGCDPRWMGEAAKVAEASGADIIDINMGCPAKRVVGGYSGSALMRTPDVALRIVEAAVSACSVPVTLKMRLGWDERTINAPEIARRAADIGIAAVTVHGRTRQQFYKGRADWQAIAPVADSVTIPVIANGDVATAADAAKCLQQSQADAVMIGRAAMGQPWLVGQIGAALDAARVAVPSAAERTAVAVEHYQTLLSLYGKHMGIRHARKHLAAYADVAREDGFIFSAADRRELVTSHDPARVAVLIAGIYAEQSREAA